MTKRLIRWAEQRINWSPEVWIMFIFCDECSVVIGDKKRVYCWRQKIKNRPYLIAKGRIQRL